MNKVSQVKQVDYDYDCHNAGLGHCTLLYGIRGWFLRYAAESAEQDAAGGNVYV